VSLENELHATANQQQADWHSSVADLRGEQTMYSSLPQRQSRAPSQPSPEKLVRQVNDVHVDELRLATDAFHESIVR